MLERNVNVADRHAVEDLIADYCFTLDDHDWTGFHALFTEQAILDFTAFGGPRCGPAAMVEYLQGVAASLQGWQHTVSTTRLRVLGPDTLVARSAAQVFLTARGADGAPGSVSSVGLWYHDQLRHTPAGWRIEQRVQSCAWVRSGT